MNKQTKNILIFGGVGLAIAAFFLLRKKPKDCSQIYQAMAKRIDLPESERQKYIDEVVKPLSNSIDPKNECGINFISA